ncbi:hypothetical protein BaOVIS_014820 [Babesia ovis]|uniref:Uncharacterized protein n=1 Tax=Babesia ovis TaxID=5869 RepID=A0A9W5TC98_BABOV|nr:hypothetical protein BaOVIS_014820 [Babesia ovis]
MKIAFNLLGYVFAFVLSSVAYGAEEVTEGHLRHVHMPRKDVILNISEEPNPEELQAELVELTDISVLSISPRKGYKLVGVTKGNDNVFMCNPADVTDEIDEVIIKKAGDLNFILVGSRKGIAYFEKRGDNYVEIDDIQKVPEAIKELVPLDMHSNVVLPICGSRRLLPATNEGESNSLICDDCEDSDDIDEGVSFCVNSTSVDDTDSDDDDDDDDDDSDVEQTGVYYLSSTPEEDTDSYDDDSDESDDEGDEYDVAENERLRGIPENVH